MINPVIVDQINKVEKGRRERQISEVQLINQAYPQQGTFPNLSKIARALISRLKRPSQKQLPEPKTGGELELSEEC